MKENEKRVMQKTRNGKESKEECNRLLKTKRTK